MSGTNIGVFDVGGIAVGVPIVDGSIVGRIATVPGVPLLLGFGVWLGSAVAVALGSVVVDAVAIGTVFA